MAKITGGCLCGEIRYESSGDPVASLNCYCRDCQYISGGPPNPAIMVQKSNFKITQGNPVEYTSKSDAGNQATRKFCGKCGTHLFAENEALQDFTSIKVGTLDNPSIFNPTTNFWVASAQPWHHIDPDLSKFETQPT